MASVTLKDVVKVYEGGVKVVDGFNLEIADREFVVLVGPSGCGKSTTLRMIAGLEELSSGTIRIGDRVVNDVPPKDRDIAMVFQNYALYPHMTVYENMVFALKLRGLGAAAIHEKAMRAAKILGIEGLLDRKPKALSGGQRQRVALGRAIVREPKCFLFDEPLSNLDAKLRVQMRAEIKQLHMSLHATTVYVTHDQEEAMTLGDRVVVMKDGVIQQCDGALEIYHHPKNRFVAGFLGSPPMNFFEGHLLAEGDRLLFDEGTAKIQVPEWARAELAPRAGTAVVMGVRPGAMSDQASARFATADNSLPMRVTLIQPLGDKMDVVLATERHPHTVAHVDAHARIRTGETLPVYIDTERVHFFAPGAVGERIATKRR
ncbi:sn-glycerol-3-phosphate ABC transporter ATP-binding protein UgpC [Polyangium sp. y55x31]|uniref:ABC transporter ATP-binding protein n=1 Tax=Polyangium sp. y55x31 TaxID=3042688 RepID=UPI002482A7BC|nr:sn-glycerol-3-phosphate ABC transporter ATP-binding protein UgpC [Polyangium sp. y55x31]MDI1479318.1 sn-glycerol-3-phosphate ABC transporter ATP-binding protein UgpC [Polyangium sp. y55x31]